MPNIQKKIFSGVLKRVGICKEQKGRGKMIKDFNEFNDINEMIKWLFGEEGEAGKASS